MTRTDASYAAEMRRPSPDSVPATDQQVVELLGLVHLTSMEFRGRAEATANSVGETFARTQVLATMVENRCTLSSVARQLGITRQSVRSIVQQLSARGLVEQIENPAHKSAPLFGATPAGVEKIRLIRHRAHPMYEAVITEFGESQVHSLTEQLTTLLRLARATPRTASEE